MAEDDFKRVVPIHPTLSTKSEMGPPIKTQPAWVPHPWRKIPSYVLCMPIKVYPCYLKPVEESVQVEASSLEALKTHVLFLGEVVANADFIDEESEEESDDDDDLVCVGDTSRPIRWDEIVV